MFPEAQSIGWGVGQILDDFDRARAMGRTGLQRCRTDFSWDTIAAQTEDHYRTALR